MWIDTHCHPFAKPFNQDRDAVYKNANNADVEGLIIVGFDQKTNRLALDEVANGENRWATLGVHPCDCSDLTDEEFEWIKLEASENKKVIAIGETGLDYHHMSFEKSVQREAFVRQIDLAKHLDLPLIVHSRDAAEDTLSILISEGIEKVVFHCFTYDYEFAKKVWGRGFYTSFSGVLTYPQAKDVQEAAEKGPLDLMHIETDCPYLTPQSKRGQRNEMAYVVEVAEKLASLKRLDLNTLSSRLRLNTQECFQIFGV